MSNRELPMMPWFPDQFASATAQWTYAERSAYRALLDVQWALGVLDPDPQRLADSIRLPLDEFVKVWPLVRVKFPTVEGGIQNPRLEEHRLKAFALKKRRQEGAEVTNAKRTAERVADRPAERGANRTAQRSAQRHASDTPISPSTSPRVREDPLTPAARGNDLANGNGRKPRETRAKSLEAWRQLTPRVDHVRSTATQKQALTWRYVQEHVDPVTWQAVEKIGGCLAIAERDRFTTGDLEARFREAYETIAGGDLHQ